MTSIVSGVRSTPALDPSNHHALFIPAERHGEPELTNTHLLTWAVPERFAVIWWVTPRRIDDLVEFIEYPILFLRVERGEVVLGLRS